MKIKTFPFIIMLVLLFSTSIFMLAINRVQAAYTLTISRNWIGCTFRGNDPYYGGSVFAYETGSTAVLVVTATADGTQINVSKVTVSFDWGSNYSVSFDPPREIPAYESRVFTVTFSVPGTSEASNLFLHAYTVFIEHVNSTVEPKKVLEEDIFKQTFGPDFAVYSTVQAEAQELNQTISRMPEPTYYYYYSSNKAKLLSLMAQNETAAGNLAYTRGDFNNSKKHYQNALNLMSQAFSAAESYASRYDDAMIRQLESTANVFSGLSNALIWVGVAAVLFGIGYIIRNIGNLGNLRKPPKNQTPT